jgi:hypothetical protein
MVRQRAPSSASNNSSNVGGGQEQVSRATSHLAPLDRSLTTPAQELDSMYDYLAKIILLGPSGSGK